MIKSDFPFLGSEQLSEKQIPKSRVPGANQGVRKGCVLFNQDFPKIFENAHYYFKNISDNLEITVPILVQTQLQIDLETIIDVPHHL